MKKIKLFVLIITVLVVSCVSNQPPVEEVPATPTEKPLADRDNPDIPKLCALTFDDGPDIVKTALVLDKLEAHGVVASFFVVGQLINSSTKPVLERAIGMGCEINNHSWGWDSLTGMTEEQIKDSVGKTTAAIEEFAGVSPAFFRAPNLATNDKVYNAINLPFAEGVLGMDWDGQGSSAEQRAKHVLNGMKDGAIILLHDVQPDPHPTPEALDILIPELKKKGYEFVTLTELFARKGVTPDPEQNRSWKYVR